MFRFVAALLFLAAPISCLDGVQLFYYSSPTSGAAHLHNITLTSANIDPAKQLKFMAHGLDASSNVSWYRPMINTYLAKGHQVVAVDWGPLASSGYPTAIKNLAPVSDMLSEYIVNIRNTFRISFHNVHCIGHSLGAHLCGFTGKKVKQRSGSKIGRISGLDPAGPHFETVTASGRLNATDAGFVDVIHTNAGILAAGITKSIGSVDFWPDGGSKQNSCNILPFGCNHNIAPVYFTESINSNKFVARKCGSYGKYLLGSCSSNPAAVMGDGCSASSTSGNYYLTTNNKAPYGKGE